MDLELLEEAGLKKIKLSKSEPFKYFLRAIMAGFYLGVASILSYSLGSVVSQIDPMLGKIAFASLFGLAFILCVFLNAELFTGNCLTTIIPVYTKKLKLIEILPSWVLCYFGNFVGAGIIGFLFIQSGALSHTLIDYLESVLVYKLEFNITQLFIRGILCNLVVCLATYLSYKMKSETAKVIVFFVVIVAFVLPGFDHSIANMVTFSMGATAFGVNLNYVQVFMNLLVSTFGNILGGSVLLALPIYLIYKPETKLH